MKTIIYTRDMEPITAVEMPAFIVRLLKERGFASVAVPLPIEMVVYSDDDFIPPPRNFMCRLWAVSSRPLIVATDDEELALALPSVWLPGQTRAVHATFDEGHNTGVARAMRMMLR